MEKNIQTLSQSEKIDILFQYIFSSDKHKEEETFWNILNEKEREELELLKKEEKFDIQYLKEKSKV